MIDIQHLAELKKRQELFLESIGDRLVIVASAYEKVRNNDVHYPFRQDSLFNYLTGFPEPESVAVFDGRERTYTLFVRKNDRFMELWTGKRFGVVGAMEVFGADTAFAVNQLEDELLKVSDVEIALFCEKNHPLESRLLTLTDGMRSDSGHEEILSIIIRMRLLKSPWELANMRQAAEISIKAHHAVMERSRSAVNEYELQAEFYYQCANQGAPSMAYPAIVASGINATCLHYMQNNQPIDRNGLLLIDAGCEVNGYAADITRTYPVSGKFSVEQKECYELVLAAQENAINKIAPGNSLSDVHEAAVETLVTGLIEMNFLSGSPEQVIQEKQYTRFYPHGTSHWLGLDVHDVGPGLDVKLEEGMTFTVEPGLYFQEDCEAVSAQFRGLGIRIEDNIAMTADGFEILTSACKKDVKSLEN
jgi:Xaa-Pro aminopeptidase